MGVTGMGENLTTEERTALQIQAWDLRVQHHLSLRQIAEKIGVSHTTVQRLLRTVENRLAKEFTEHAQRVKARQAAQLEHIAKDALEQWYRSCGEQVTVTVQAGRVHVLKLRDGDSDGYTERERIVELPDLTTTATKTQTGDPQLLAQAISALAAVRSIWGLDAPKRTDLTSDDQPLKAIIGVSLDEL